MYLNELNANESFVNGTSNKETLSYSASIPSSKDDTYRSREKSNYSKSFF